MEETKKTEAVTTPEATTMPEVTAPNPRSARPPRRPSDKLAAERLKRMDYTLNKTADALARFTPAQMLEFYERRIQGQGKQLRKAVFKVYDYLTKVAEYRLTRAENWFLTAPSGCGKTEFFRATRDWFSTMGIPIPVVQIDLSLFTEQGYKGDNPSTITEKICCGNNSTGYAICFLDEADKKLKPSFDSHGANVNMAVQGNLLTIVEGIKTVDDGGRTFDTNKTMFIFMGAFADLRNDRANAKKTLGFGSNLDGSGFNTDGLYKEITIDDIIKYGMTEELAGRVSQVINFQRLSESEMRRLLYIKAREIGTEMGMAVELTYTAIDELLKMSYGPLGIRQPMNLMRTLVQDAVAEVFFTNGFNKKADKVLIRGRDLAEIVPLDYYEVIEIEQNPEAEYDRKSRTREANQHWNCSCLAG